MLKLTTLSLTLSSLLASEEADFGKPVIVPKSELEQVSKVDDKPSSKEVKKKHTSAQQDTSTTLSLEAELKRYNEAQRIINDSFRFS